MSGHEHAGEHGHDHHHGGYDVDPTHHHPPQPDLEDIPLSRHQLMQMALTGLLIEKGVSSPPTRCGPRSSTWTPSARRAARELVARAWVDDGFRERLVADSKSAATELGMDIGPIPILVMENTPETHNLVVCTLCSCYPRFLLGTPPELVQVEELPEPGGARAARGAGRVRDRKLRPRWTSASTTAPPTCATWFSRCDRSARKG